MLPRRKSLYNALSKKALIELSKSYLDHLQRLFSLSRGLEKRSLQNMQTMSRLLGHPERSFPAIHIAGTNGKGSVCLKMSKALELSGFRCGLFSSPHISCFRERIRIGSEFIAESDVSRLLSTIQRLEREAQLQLTFFEYCTLLAFEYFAKNKVDIAVIETGIGGRLDATNILIPILSVITSIGLDHTEILGATKRLIASEKGGIIKPSIPILIGPTVPVHPIRKIADPLRSPLTIIPHQNLSFNLENASIAKKGLDLLSDRFPLQPDAIAQALAIDPPCRFEKVPPANLARSPLKILSRPAQVVLDVAHNPQGFERLVQRVRLEYPNRAIHFMVSFCRNKDIAQCAKAIFPIATSIAIPRIGHYRLASPEYLLPYFERRQTRIDFPIPLLESYLPELERGDLLVICGSFFMMSSMREALGYLEPRDP